MRKEVRAFFSSKSGSVPILFAIGAVGMLGVGGLAMDYTRASGAKSALFSAADAAALAAARTIGTPADRERTARRVFRSNIRNLDGVSGVALSPQNVQREGFNVGYKVGVTANVKMNFGGFFGASTLAVSVLAEAEGSINNFTEVALVLDTTYSMTGWKMNTLKQAARKMIDDLQPLATEPDRLKFALVPFAQHINIGMANRNKPWLNIPADYQDPPTPAVPPSTSCGMVTPVIGQTNCRMQSFPGSPATPPSPPSTCYNDGVPYSCGGGGGSPGTPPYTAQVCDPVYGPPQNQCWTDPGRPAIPGAWHRWKGCIGSRNAPLNTQDGSYANRIPALTPLDREDCSAEVSDLTTNLPVIKAKIQALVPAGETYIPAGLIWGWRMLSPGEPFSARASTATAPVKKFLVLMTDGLNTKSPTYPNHDGTDGAQSNQLVRQICENIRADAANEITIFTVAFDVADNTTKNILKDCATNTKGKFFDARNSAQFLDAFADISTSIAGLRLTK